MFVKRIDIGQGYLGGWKSVSVSFNVKRTIANLGSKEGERDLTRLVVVVAPLKKLCFGCWARSSFHVDGGGFHLRFTPNWEATERSRKHSAATPETVLAKS